MTNQGQTSPKPKSRKDLERKKRIMGLMMRAIRAKVSEDEDRMDREWFGPAKKLARSENP